MTKQFLKLWGCVVQQYCCLHLLFRGLLTQMQTVWESELRRMQKKGSFRSRAVNDQNPQTRLLREYIDWVAPSGPSPQSG